MSEHDRDLERVRLAGQRLIAADRERRAALSEATAALGAVHDLPVAELSGRSGLSRPAVHALLSRAERTG